MSDDGLPPVPTATDPNGRPLIGVQAFNILNRTLNVDRNSSLGPADMFDRGFKSGPWGAPQLPYAVAATWCYSSMSFGLQQQQIQQLFSLYQSQQQQLAGMSQFMLEVAQTLQRVMQDIDEDNADMSALRGELEELLDSVVVVQTAPPQAQEVEEGKNGKEKPETS